ncbi:MAG: phosphoribosyltransferase [Synechococcales cyanobacterium C42_A2020_086]|nr:phosphoribosyltransferase [Synechococcales cyanobacterium M58_A2018_015]MBF2072764.1 phosphoribosyltransferase [Synechococcales cyanobacterium C42_A2020_086]
MTLKFWNRSEAGQLLAAKLMEFANRSDVIVLALPRGGVPVAYEIAKALQVPLDICLVRKLGVPEQEELAMGAIASGGVLILNNEVLRALHISRQTLLKVAALERQELERRDRTYRGDRPPPVIHNRTVILVDDGIATSSTLRAAIAALMRQHPKDVIVAVPVAPESTCIALRTLVSDVVCLSMPNPLNSIGMWYRDFSQTTDEEVCRLLAQPTVIDPSATP